MRHLFGGLILLAGCARAPVPPTPPATQRLQDPGPGIIDIVRDARLLADDSLRGRGPWAPETNRVARMLAARLEELGARPVFGTSLLVPFTAAPRINDTVYNVIGVIPPASGSVSGRLVGI